MFNFSVLKCCIACQVCKRLFSKTEAGWYDMIFISSFKLQIVTFITSETLCTCCSPHFILMMFFPRDGLPQPQGCTYKGAKNRGSSTFTPEPGRCLFGPLRDCFAWRLSTKPIVYYWYKISNSVILVSFSGLRRDGKC